MPHDRISIVHVGTCHYEVRDRPLFGDRRVVAVCKTREEAEAWADAVRERIRGGDVRARLVPVPPRTR